MSYPPPQAQGQAHRPFKDRRLLARYAVVGMGSAGAHVGLLILLVEFTGWAPVLASSASFGTVTLLAFLLHHRWVYASSQPLSSTGPRFVAVTTTAFVINAATMGLGAARTDQHYLIVQAVAFVLLPISNYLLHTLWTFAERR